MNRLNKTITINTPVHTIFQYIREPVNLPHLCPHLVTVDDIQRLPNGGRSFNWEYKLVNVHFFGSSTTTLYESDHQIICTIQGGIAGKIAWLFQPDDEATHLTLSVEYTLPDPFVQKHGTYTIASEVEQVLNTALESLRATLEKVEFETNA